MSYTVFHLLGGFAVCRTMTFSPPWWAGTHCATCTCPDQGPRAEHGAYVTCGYCEKIGILPDPGHEDDFMPPDVSLTTSADGTRAWHFRA